EGVPVFRHEVELNPRFAEHRERLRGQLDALGAEILLPILYQGELRYVLSLGARKSGRMFAREDLDLLRTLAAQGAIALENSRLFEDLADSLKQVQMLETVKSNLSKFVPETVKTMVEGAEDAEELFQKRDRDLSVMFADMTGYTRLSARLPIEDVNAIIERYFGAFLDEILQRGGDVNETAGDGLMVLFQDDDPERHARAAVDTALAIQERTREINAEREAEGGAPVGMHIGINSGTASVGATKIAGGVGLRWTFTASGPVTNIAARVGALGEAIAITGETRSRLGEGYRLEELGPRELKNVAEPVVVHRVIGDEGTREGEPAPAPAVRSERLAEDGVVERIREGSHALGPGRFAIRGSLRSTEDGRALPGLRIHAFDKDWIRDDYLGHATSAEDGSFEILFTDELFGDLFEREPDIYLVVNDERDQEELHHTRDAVRWNAQGVEYFELEIPRARLSATGR
ncbi:MAG: adenylate/guanylate cyclase domain-containing protein, partial [Gemmatimonadota bacterium]|nr:adenylate/guanylate cyclase domain-containing protein [Gemmatimonadota bacterium]